MKGSLKTLLLDHTNTLDWGMRLTFITDVANGMRYLHDRQTIHRDLKADNCFVDASLRVKVADFGTGRIAANIQGSHASFDVGGGQVREHSATLSCLPLSQSPSQPHTWAGTNVVRDRTLSKGVGTLLWMAPEVLSGSRIKEGHATALDVYSYGIVLWEVWAREQPWGEIVENGVNFVTALTELVTSGVRPRLPDTDQVSSGSDRSGRKQAKVPPTGYAELMNECWASQAEKRPSFSVVVSRLSKIRGALARDNRHETAL